MRIFLPMAAVVVLAGAGIASAQFSLSSLMGGAAKTPAPPTISSLSHGVTMGTTPTTATLSGSKVAPTTLTNAMTANQNILKNSGKQPGQSNPRTFNFAKLVPNFSFMNKKKTPLPGTKTAQPKTSLLDLKSLIPGKK